MDIAYNAITIIFSLTSNSEAVLSIGNYERLDSIMQTFYIRSILVREMASTCAAFLTADPGPPCRVQITMTINNDLNCSSRISRNFSIWHGSIYYMWEMWEWKKKKIKRNYICRDATQTSEERKKGKVCTALVFCFVYYSLLFRSPTPEWLANTWKTCQHLTSRLYTRISVLLRLLSLILIDNITISFFMCVTFGI